MEHLSHTLSLLPGLNFQRFTARQNLTICPFCDHILNHIKKRSTGAYKTCKNCQVTYFVPAHRINN